MIAVYLREGVRTEKFRESIQNRRYLQIVGDVRMSRLYLGAVLVDPVGFDEKRAIQIISALPTVRSVEIIPQEKIWQLPRLIISPTYSPT